VAKHKDNPSFACILSIDQHIADSVLHSRYLNHVFNVSDKQGLKMASAASVVAYRGIEKSNFQVLSGSMHAKQQRKC
jgi:hypothetical protein